jgi:hypothetical protein
MCGVRGGAAEDLSLWTGPASTVAESIRRAGQKDREAWPAALGGAGGGEGWRGVAASDLAKDHGICVSAASGKGVAVPGGGLMTVAWPLPLTTGEATALTCKTRGDDGGVACLFFNILEK